MAQVANVEKVKKVEETEKIIRKTITVRVPEGTHQRFKAIVKMANVSMQTILSGFIASYVEENFNPDIHTIDEG